MASQFAHHRGVILERASRFEDCFAHGWGQEVVGELGQLKRLLHNARTFGRATLKQYPSAMSILPIEALAHGDSTIQRQADAARDIEQLAHVAMFNNSIPLAAAVLHRLQDMPSHNRPAAFSGLEDFARRFVGPVVEKNSRFYRTMTDASLRILRTVRHGFGPEEHVPKIMEAVRLVAQI